MTKPKTPAPRTARLDDESVVDEICDRLASGEGLKAICANKHLPSDDTVYRKMANDPDFAARIARAREAQQDHEADAIVDMADKATPEDWQVVKLRIWARQWRAAKLAPKKYGDDLRLRHADAEGGNLSREMSESDMAVRLASLFASVRQRHPEKFSDMDGGEP